MGMIKRALKRTSRKILAKIVPTTNSLQPASELIVASSADSTANKRHLSILRKKLKRSSKDTAVAEALLLAARNYLPPVQFHHVYGPNVQLSANKCVARRTQSFCQALVFSNRVILPNERVYIKVLEIAKGWSGTIRFGFTAVDPATLACRMPKHACPDMTNAGHTWARALADEVVRRNSVIHFSYNKSGLIHYGINNQDCGVFHANVSTNQNLWFIVDIYGLTAAVELIDPRVNNNNATSEIDGGAINLADAAGNNSQSTMFKSTSAMNEIFGQYATTAGIVASRSRKKQSRRLAARQTLMNDWALENATQLGSSFLGLGFNPHTQQYTQTGMQLPNLNALDLPSAQQNIYSPMPSELPTLRNAQQIADSHDYQQILNNTCPSNLYQSTSTTRVSSATANPRLAPSISVANVSMPNNLQASAATNSFSSSSGNLNASSSASASASASSSSSSSSVNNQRDLSRRLKNLTLVERLSSTRQQQSASRAPRSTSATRTPVASARRRLDSTQTNLKRPQDSRTDKSTIASQRVVGSSSKSKVASSVAPAQSSTTASGSASTKTNKSSHRHSTSSKGQKVSSSSKSDRDKHNNSPLSKDCPICFERPINCVLYQCGHMCTCYECGVKQWKTESRTCPICRTIIKDVIKTYMS